MNSVIIIFVIITLVGSALIAGVFFAFSSFIMKALARRPSKEGMAAMQSINVVVINSLFLGVFMGTAVMSLLLVIISIMKWELLSAPYFLSGALLYIVGTFLVTGMGNVPLNNQLAAIAVTDDMAEGIWQLYLERWTWLNTLRTICAVAATVVLIIGLVKY